MINQSTAKIMEMNIRISFYSNHCHKLTFELSQNINQPFKKYQRKWFGSEAKINIFPKLEMKD